jgi:integrase
MPKAQRVIIPIFTRLEVDAMEEYNRAIKRRYQFALLLAFIGQSAMRIGETLNQQWEDIDENRIFVKGKSVRQRNIPLKQFPRLEALLDELSQVTGHQEYLFHWKTPKQVTDMLKQTAESLGFKARGFHSIRKMRENEWIDDYKYPPHVAAMLCGHSVEIQQKYYRQKPTWSQVEDHIPGPS